MAYSDFTLRKAKAQFQLETGEFVSLFDEVPEAQISSYLGATLCRKCPAGIVHDTEKPAPS